MRFTPERTNFNQFSMMFGWWAGLTKRAAGAGAVSLSSNEAFCSPFPWRLYIGYNGLATCPNGCLRRSRIIYSVFLVSQRIRTSRLLEH